jgi:hypothetical protein
VTIKRFRAEHEAFRTDYADFFWVVEEINKWQRAFFWVAKDQVNGGQCLVAWDSICKPYEFGGLGVKNLRLQGLALRVRWEWLRRTDLSRPWQGLPR